MRIAISVCLCVYLWLSPHGPVPVEAQPKKDEKKAAPEVKLVIPLGVKPGTTTKITLRGLKLDSAREVKFGGGIQAKIISKGGAGVPDKNPQQVGDTQVVVELTTPKTLDDKLPFTVVTADGETIPHQVLVENKLPVMAEKEPNEGFRQSQSITLPVLIDGMIDRPRDVDVFRFSVAEKTKVSFEVLAARYGSPLDAVLTLYDAGGQQLARGDDMKESVDARIAALLPAAGEYFLVVMDAHDGGSNLHVYRLVGRVE